VLSNNTNTFYELVRAGLWEKDARLSQYGSIDFNEIIRLSEEQSVVGLVAAGIEHVVDLKIPQDVALQFVGQTLQLEQRNSAMNHFIAELIEKLRSASIYTLLLKGQAVAQSYERPIWRACGDVDLFLSHDNYEKAKAFLLPKADSCEQEWKTSQHLGMTIDGWTVEIHGSLKGSLSRRINRTLDDIRKETFFEGKVRSWINENSQIFLLEINNDIIYVFTHFLNHFYKGGIGLRQICDWCRLLWTYKDLLSQGLLESRIKNMGVMSEWKAFGAFAVDYLGMPSEIMPLYSPDVKWKRKADKISLFIMEVGNFGHNRDMSYYQKSFFVQKFKSFCRKCEDFYHHSKIFPFDSTRFFSHIVIKGLRSAVNREG
jgi:hypothetical protein